ncbi:hypothetical protein, partial [Mycobacterium avium]
MAVDRSAGMTESGGPTNYPIPAPPAGRCCAAHAPGMMLANERSRRLLPTTSTLATIKTNLVWAFGYNLAAIPLAA